jgi:hypothetical protein
LDEVEHQATRWDTPDHLIAQRLRAAPGNPLKDSISIFVVVAVSGAWLALVLFVLRAIGIHVP